jgi:murein DD-endopeptidase MepM/ murein hydrolase activator NlpD
MSRYSRCRLLVVLLAAAAMPRLVEAYDRHAVQAGALPDCARCETGAEVVADPPVGYEWPVEGLVVRQFGEAIDGTRSDGVDIVAAEGTPVLAAQDGIVAYAGSDLRSYGNLLLIGHPQGFTTVYAHNAQILVRVGQRVRRGQPVAILGRTGDAAVPILHFQLRAGVRPMDPGPVLTRADAILTADVH